MRRWSVWTASVIGAVGAGAGLAAATRRRGAERPPAPESEAAPPPLPFALPDGPADDPEAALDAARERLRRRADELRQRIESSGDGAGGG